MIISLLLLQISRLRRVFYGPYMKIIFIALFFLLGSPAQELLAAADAQRPAAAAQGAPVKATEPRKAAPSAPDKSASAKPASDKSGNADSSKAAPDAPGDGESGKAEGKADKEEEGEEAQDSEESANIARINQAWESIWSGQKEMVNEIRDTAVTLSDQFAAQTKNLAGELRPYEEEGRRLLVFANSFHAHPNAMEAVNRRLEGIVYGMNTVLAPVNEAREEAEGLLTRINQMAKSIPSDIDKSRMAPEMRQYVDDINRARFRLMAVIAQYDSILPSLDLVYKLESERKEISKNLPELWKNRYMQKPVPWLSPAEWANTVKEISYSWQAIMLRLPVELPLSSSQWSTVLMRFFIGLFFSTAAALLLRRRWLDKSSSPASRQIFKISVPFLIFGIAFLGSSISATGEFYRIFLALGSTCMILGQVFLAWDLRCLQYPEGIKYRPPFLKLLPLVFCAYGILYLPLSAPLALVLWTVFLIAALVKPFKKSGFSASQFQLESGVLDSYAIMLWICLFVSVCGFQIYSMMLYIAYTSLSVVIELILGGMNLVNAVNEHLPQEGSRAVVARLLVALAAPFVVVVAFFGLSLWILIVPGGSYLIKGYALKGITVGATQFNIIQILLILSAFYLTRTVVSMGTKFLSKLPQKGIHFDSTLITPLQTVLTYSAWAVFGLFVLRSLGMQLSNLAMVAGGLSVGIGFGMQTIVNNFLSGLILIFGRTLQVGDVVDVSGTVGRVRKISVRATMVETPNNAIIYVPNSAFMSEKLINWTSFTRSVRREVEVGVAYGSDTELVTELLIGIAKEHENVQKYPAPSVIFNDFAASALDFRLRFWVMDYDLGAKTASDIRFSINKVFAERGIEIAFPQLDVHLKDMPAERPGEAACRPATGESAPKRASAGNGGAGAGAGSASGSAESGRRLERARKRITRRLAPPRPESQTS